MVVAVVVVGCFLPKAAGLAGLEGDRESGFVAGGSMVPVGDIEAADNVVVDIVVVVVVDIAAVPRPAFAGPIAQLSVPSLKDLIAIPQNFKIVIDMEKFHINISSLVYWLHSWVQILDAKYNLA